MKRLIAALGLSAVALSASALEYGPPFEQLNLDRALPNIEFAPVAPYVAGSRAPFEQLAIDRALPNLPSRNVQFAASAGDRPAPPYSTGQVGAIQPRSCISPNQRRWSSLRNCARRPPPYIMVRSVFAPRSATGALVSSQRRVSCRNL